MVPAGSRGVSLEGTWRGSSLLTRGCVRPRSSPHGRLASCASTQPPGECSRAGEGELEPKEPPRPDSEQLATAQLGITGREGSRSSVKGICALLFFKSARQDQ